jgi:hypothetical protein
LRTSTDLILESSVHAAQLPEDALVDPLKYGLGLVVDTSLPLDKKDAEDSKEDPEPMEKEEHKSQFFPPDDPAKILQDVTTEDLKTALDSMAKDRAALLIDAHYIMRIISQKEYTYCHLGNASADERQNLLREIQMYQVMFGRLKSEADKLDRQILVGSQRLRQKLSWAGEDTLPSWEMPAVEYKPETHEPKHALPEIERYTEKLPNDIKDIEKALATQGISDEDKQRLKRDLDDARELLRASDKIYWDLEKRIKKVDAEADGEVKEDKAVEVEAEAEADTQASKSDKKEVGMDTKDSKSEKKVVMESKRVKSDDMEPSKP